MGIGYIQFISIAYIVLVHISISVPYKETIEDIGAISIHKLMHENANKSPTEYMITNTTDLFILDPISENEGLKSLIRSFIHEILLFQIWKSMVKVKGGFKVQGYIQILQNLWYLIKKKS